MPFSYPVNGQYSMLLLSQIPTELILKIPLPIPLYILPKEKFIHLLIITSPVFRWEV